MSSTASHNQAPIFNHTMVRVRDPAKSRHFYESLLGMTHIVKLDFEGGKFSLHFLAFDVPDNIKSAEHDERRKYAFSRPGVLELTHNWGTESDASFAGYSNGNTDPGRGYGHIGICVDDVDAFCKFLEDNGVAFKKKPNEGSMKGIAFALDPDGYWVEILPKRY
ncbi:Glyoxalase/Bleomycin resistance protein/Dihydroxybiphenyl dioxygenase [Zopfochytrium polystomum]|nr:Glyoxalase/Bleomycin resistance protein/Dihydroxybiphenyl dioxygenase [Zopfochytrium polystomum]